MSKVKKAAQTGDKEAVKQMGFFSRLVEHLEQGNSARGLELEEFEEPLMKEMQLLTSKPILYVCNVDEGAVVDGNTHVERVKEVAASEGAGVLVLGAAIEADIAELEDADERALFLTDLGLEEPGVAKLIRAAYSLLDLQTYFTAGEKEVRAWTIQRGYTAPQAAGVIHTDFQKGFIRAEVSKYEDYVGLGSELAVKEAGKLSVEGKEYIVQDGTSCISDSCLIWPKLASWPC